MSVVLIALIVLAAFAVLCCWVYFTTPKPKPDPHADVARMESGKR